MGVFRSAHCGSVHGAQLHAQHGEDPCVFCAAALKRRPAEPAGPWRYYLTAEGAVLGTDAPTPALLALVDSGQARLMDGSEAAQRLGGI